MELFEQHDLDGHIQVGINLLRESYFVIMTQVARIESEIEFVAVINDRKDCLMAQDNTQDDPDCMWFNIDVPKGHGLKAGDRVRITVEKL